MAVNPYNESQCYGLGDKAYNECKANVKLLAAQWEAQQQAVGQIAGGGISPVVKISLIIAVIIFISIIGVVLYRKYKK